MCLIHEYPTEKGLKPYLILGLIFYNRSEITSFQILGKIVIYSHSHFCSLICSSFPIIVLQISTKKLYASKMHI